MAWHLHTWLFTLHTCTCLPLHCHSSSCLPLWREKQRTACARWRLRRTYRSWRLLPTPATLYPRT